MWPRSVSYTHLDVYKRQYLGRAGGHAHLPARADHDWSRPRHPGACLLYTSFAIPIDTAKPIIDELIEKGYVSGRPAIGLDGETLPAPYRIYYRLPEGIYAVSYTHLVQAVFFRQVDDLFPRLLLLQEDVYKRQRRDACYRSSAQR